jgi:hypothetical protein
MKSICEKFGSKPVGNKLIYTKLFDAILTTRYNLTRFFSQNIESTPHTLYPQVHIFLEVRHGFDELCCLIGIGSLETAPQQRATQTQRRKELVRAFSCCKASTATIAPMISFDPLP